MHTDSPQAAMAALPPIDLTRETDVAYWCRIFDVSPAQLREAVHHAGHRAEDVQHYLREHHIRAE